MTFTLVKSSLSSIPPITFVAIRFLTGSFVIALFAFLFNRGKFNFNKNEWRAGSVIGFFLFSGYLAQTIGISKTTASNASFITGLSVILVPIIMRFSGKTISGFSWAGIILSFIGVSLISLSDQLSINPGDALVALCALLFAFQIYYVSQYSTKFSVVNITVIQVAVCGILSAIGALIYENPISALGSMDRAGFNGFLFCALPGTALAYIVQNQAQKTTSPERAALIFSFEPVFGAFFAYLLAGERLSERGLIGASLMFVAMLVTDLGPYLQRKIIN